MSERMPVTPVEPHESDPATDEIFANLLQSYENRIPDSYDDAKKVVEEIRGQAAYAHIEDDGTASVGGVPVNKSLVEELQDKAATADVNTWRLSAKSRKEQEAVVATRNWNDLSPEQRAEMKRFQTGNVYEPLGKAFAKVQAQAEKRLALDDEIKAREAKKGEVAKNLEASHKAFRDVVEEPARKAARAEKELTGAAYRKLKQELAAEAPQKIDEAVARRMQKRRFNEGGMKFDNDPAYTQRVTQELRKEVAEERKKADDVRHGNQAERLAQIREELAAAQAGKPASKTPSQQPKPVEKRVIDPNVNKEKVHENTNLTTDALRKFYRKQLLGEQADPATTGTAPAGTPETKTATRTPEANGRFTNQDFIQFTDREIGLSFSTVGTQIALGAESTHPSAQNFGAEGDNMALIYTDNGVYGLAKGRLISMRTGEATEQPQDTVNFSIGDTVMMPGSDKPTEILEVLLQYKMADEVLQGAEQATRPSPFTKLREKLAENGVAVDPTKVTPVAPAAPQLPALTQQPAAPKAPAPEKRKKGRRLLAFAAGALAVAGIFGGMAANNSGDAPNKELAATSHSVEDDKKNRSDMSVEKGKTVRIDVERGNGITQEVEQQADAQGISATPAKLKQMYKDFEDQGRFDKVKGLYEMDNGDYGFANAGKQVFPADLMTDMLEWLRTH